MEEKILHIVNDEKIIDRTIEYFESVYPNRNKFILIVPQIPYKCKFITKETEVELLTMKDNRLMEICNDSSYRHLIVHMLTDTHVKLINRIQHSNITWIVWGSDLYSGLLVQRGFRLYRDNKILLRLGNNPILRRMVLWGNNWYEMIRVRKRVRAVKKIKNVAMIDDDYNLLMTYYPEFGHLKRKNFFYYPIDAILSKNYKDIKIDGDGILIGNSSSPTGNHLYVLNKILETNIDTEITIPLSYGNDEYREYLIKEIKKNGSNKISILTQYLPLQEYNKILCNSSNYIYGNLRQEAIGNIVIGFYLGAKIFLEKKNPMFNYFRNMGLKVFSIDEINYTNLVTPLDLYIKDNNRSKIIREYNIDNLKKYIKNSFPLN